MGICTKCGRNVIGTCTVCVASAGGTFGKSPKKKKLGLKKYIGKAKKANPFTANVSTTYAQSQQQQTQPAKRLPSLPPAAKQPQPLYDQQSITRWTNSFQLPNEPLIAEFWCKAVSGSIYLEGSTYITPNYFAFTAPFNNNHVYVLIPFKDVLDIKSASPIATSSGTTFQMEQNLSFTSSCVQFYSKDKIKHQFFDCKLVKDFATWFQLITDNWHAAQ